MKLFINDVDVNTYGFILANYSVGKATPRTNKIQVPGRHGKVDVSKAITGCMIYDNRTVQVQLLCIGEGTYRQGCFDTLVNLICDKECKISFSNIQGYYKGVCSIEKMATSGLAMNLILSFDCYPFRVKEHKSQTVSLTSEPKTIQLQAIQSTYPSFTVSDSATIAYNGRSKVYTSGLHQGLYFIDSSVKSLDISGSGTCKIEYDVEVL